MGLLFTVLAMVAEFESDLIRLRTVEGMTVGKAKGRLRGKQPKPAGTAPAGPGTGWGLPEFVKADERRHLQSRTVETLHPCCAESR